MSIEEEIRSLYREPIRGTKEFVADRLLEPDVEQLASYVRAKLRALGEEITVGKRYKDTFGREYGSVSIEDIDAALKRMCGEGE